MKKSIFASFALLLLMAILAYNVYSAKLQKQNFSKVNKEIETIRLLDKDFDIYLENILAYDNFDIIETKINLFKKTFFDIYKNKILNKIDDSDFKAILYELEKSSKNKINKISKVKSHRAILNNSFRLIHRMKKNIKSKSFDDIYVSIVTLGNNPEIDIKTILKNINNLKTNGKYEKFFLVHAKIILENQLILEKLEKDIKSLEVNKKLNDLHLFYEEYTQSSVQKAHLSIGVLFSLLLIFIIFYVIHEYKLALSNNQLSRFKKTVENSDNIVVVTDENELIKYVNEEFTKTTGYTLEEVVGKKPSILKSGKQSKEFYEDLNKTIHSGKKWSGEFVNVDKFGQLSYEKASITPVLDDNGKIKEFISIKLDITNETVKGQQLKEKEKLLVQQSKMAAMGEMLNNIAHQWRQPLSTITTGATGAKLQKEMNILSDESFSYIMDEINDSAQYLSTTIENFRSFFDHQDTTMSQFFITQTIKKTINLVGAQLKSNEITIIENVQEQTIISLENELIQVLINILNNSRDALINLKKEKKFIFIDVYTKDDKLVIEIKDNAQGIPEDIIDRIFEPYFTTKHKSQGTGVGLYMCQNIVTTHLNGTICVKNIKYNYNDKEYLGANFIIELPITNKNEEANKANSLI